jgi:hypothetical protein
MYSLISVKRFKNAVSALAIAALALVGISASAYHGSPGEAGMTKVNIYDNTNDGWNVTVGDPDPVIGFVNFRPTTPDDPSVIVVTVSLKDAAPSCDYEVQLVTTGSDETGGLAPDGSHTGIINTIGTIETNKQGIGNTGAIVVDVNTLIGTATSTNITYAHVDLEDFDGDCTEADGTGVANNEYGASGKIPGSTLDLPTNIHWLQP